VKFITRPSFFAPRPLSSCTTIRAVTPAPSPEDIDITKRLKQVGDILGIRVLDHIVIGSEGYFSFSDKGML
jgi:hypothetical protein